MRFLLEEASWAWDGSDPAGYIERIEQLLDRLDVAFERCESFAASDELLRQPIRNGYSLASILWDPGSPLGVPHEVRERLAAHLSRMLYWDAMDVPVFDVNIAGEEVISPSAARAHGLVRRRIATACLPLPGKWSGPTIVRIGDESALVHFVVNEQTHRAFFRDALDVERSDESSLPELAPHAFPDLLFVGGVWHELRDFEGGYRRVRADLHRLLATLDDHGAWVFTDYTGRLSPAEPIPSDGRRIPVTNQLIERRFHGWGFDVAPENPDVRTDRTCRRARERRVGGETLYCEWHYKFEPYINRVHLHGPVRASSGRLIVAIFASHLPLP